MNRKELEGQLKELTINLKWANTLVEQSKKSLASLTEDHVKSFIEITTSINNEMSTFCTTLDTVFNEPELDDEEIEELDKNLEQEQCVKAHDVTKKITFNDSVSPQSKNDVEKQLA